MHALFADPPPPMQQGGESLHPYQPDQHQNFQQGPPHNNMPSHETWHPNNENGQHMQQHVGPPPHKRGRFPDQQQENFGQPPGMGFPPGGEMDPRNHGPGDMDPRNRGPPDMDLRKGGPPDIDPRNRGPPDMNPRNHGPPMGNMDPRNHGPPMGDMDPRNRGQSMGDMDQRNRGPLMGDMDQRNRGPPMSDMDQRNRGPPMDPRNQGPPMDPRNQGPPMDSRNHGPPGDMDQRNHGPHSNMDPRNQQGPPPESEDWSQKHSWPEGAPDQGGYNPRPMRPPDQGFHRGGRGGFRGSGPRGPFRGGRSPYRVVNRGRGRGGYQS